MTTDPRIEAVAAQLYQFDRVNVPGGDPSQRPDWSQLPGKFRAAYRMLARKVLRVADAAAASPKRPIEGTECLVVHWKWTEGKYKDGTFWACHSVENDGRVNDWPKLGMQPVGAAKVIVVDGQGLDLLPTSSLPQKDGDDDRTTACRQSFSQAEAASGDGNG